MGRKSRAPDGWVSLYQVARRHDLGRNTELVAGLCRMAGLETRRHGGVACMKSADIEDWRWWLRWWRSRPTMYAKRRRRRCV